MNNFAEVTSEDQGHQGEERYLRTIDEKCWISVLYRLTGFGHREWETAIVFVADGQQPTWRDRTVLIVHGDWRSELNDMPKDQLRAWYDAKIDDNRTTMHEILHQLNKAAESAKSN